ncbi:MAG TPA: hypothetical protein PKD94_15515 [Ignavibacteria bacterium]|nr:hypothetical protein [Ignavibacteria bacterium]
MNIKKLKYYILLFICTVTLYNCTDVPEGLVTNSAPETFLSLFPDSIISPHITRIKITWWGDDPDGLIQGYRFSFDSTNWTYSEGNDSTFQLVIVGNDSTFRFWVSAVDDKGNIDPTPASNLYPVFNSPPSVSFNTGTEIPDTSFTVGVFSWTGSDPDGNNSVSKYYWALNDTSAWNEVSATTNSLTLRESNGIIPNSNNKLYLKVRDIAGIFSQVVTMPDSSDTWYVRQPQGRILLIDDYPSTVLDNGAAAVFYQNALDSFGLYSKLDIKTSSGANLPKIVSMFTETMKLFQCVVWYANRGNSSADNANFDLAQQTLPFYLATGGKVFFSTGFPNAIEQQGSIINFAPVDSVTNFQANMPFQTQIVVVDNSYPVLEAGSPSLELVRGIKFTNGTPVIYNLPFNPPYDPAQLTVCIKDAAVNTKVMFLSIPLNRMNGNGNATYFLRRAIGTDLGITN